MPYEVQMPKLAMTQEIGTILQWYKAEGDTVEVGEPILEVMTNKINIDVESYHEGILLKRLYETGAEVPVLNVIAYIGQSGEQIPKTDFPGSTTAPETEQPSGGSLPAVGDSASMPIAAGGLVKKVRATPAARALARKHSVDLANIGGSGRRGRIHREDVEAFWERRTPSAMASPAERRQQEMPAAKPQMRGAAPAEELDLDLTVTPLTGMRRLIGQRMADSAFHAPHVTLCLEVDMSAAKDMRQKLIPVVEQQTGLRLSINTIILKAVASVLHKYPNVNSTWKNDSELIYHKSVHLAMAVSVPNGLLVPVIRHSDRMGIGELTEAAKRLSDEARAQKLSPDALQGGTFTVSNLGMYEIEEFTPIINQPQVAILGVGCVIDKPAAVQGELVIRPQMKLNLSFDHRALDGSEAAMFLKDLKHILEEPLFLLA